MYPNYYGTQLNTIISYQESIYSELQSINSNFSLLINVVQIILFVAVLSVTVGFIRKIFSVGR